MVWFQLVVSAKWTNKIALFFPAILWRSPRQWSTVCSVLEKLWKTVRLRAACLPFDRHAAGFDLGDAELTRKNCFLLSSMSVWDIMHAFTRLGSATGGLECYHPKRRRHHFWEVCRKARKAKWAAYCACRSAREMYTGRWLKKSRCERFWTLISIDSNMCPWVSRTELQQIHSS